MISHAHGPGRGPGPRHSGSEAQAEARGPDSEAQAEQTQAVLADSVRGRVLPCLPLCHGLTDMAAVHSA
jgi:hypothetical protein